MIAEKKEKFEINIRDVICVTLGERTTLASYEVEVESVWQTLQIKYNRLLQSTFACVVLYGMCEFYL